ncbi:MAG: DNA-binding protein [Segetibacter sp.]|nr:DNA-binding protein [Segetibacter sp.]
MKKYVLGLWVLLILSACNTSKHTIMKNGESKTYAIRLLPGDDLKVALEKFVTEKKIEAGWIVTCVGSLTDYNIRFANKPSGDSAKGHFEIVSLVGTLSTNGSHIHLSISDSTGKTIAGHLLEGCKIFTTAEIVIQQSSSFIFKREIDGSTPWKELQVVPAKAGNSL